MKRNYFNKLLINFLLIFLVISCSKSNYLEENFKKLLESKKNEENNIIFYQSKDLNNKYINRYYEKIVNFGKKGNDFLLKQAELENKTKFIMQNIAKLTEGDLAICLLLDINKISDKNFENYLVPDNLKIEYKRNGAHIWWDWIHQNKENRDWIIKKINYLIK